jgi:hypothetical protein
MTAPLSERRPLIVLSNSRKGQERKEKTARKKVRKRTRKEDRKANPAPGPI